MSKSKDPKMQRIQKSIADLSRDLKTLQAAVVELSSGHSLSDPKTGQSSTLPPARRRTPRSRTGLVP